MKREYNLALILASIGVVMIIAGLLMIGLESYKKERCYSMPLNQYVEDSSCTKYTWEEYMEEHYGK